MIFTYDPAKNAKNIAERDIAFDKVEEFEWDTALIREDTRKDYGERRFQAMGVINDRLHVLVFTPRNNAVHVISLRKANQREGKIYAKEKEN